MRAFLDDLLRQTKAIWSRLDGGQRFVIVAVLAAATVGLSAILWYAGRPSYETVLTTTSAEELKQARQALSTAGIPFQPDASGTSILVERSRIAAANMAINEAGLRGNADRGLAGGSIIEDAETKAYRLDAAARAQAAAAIQALDGVTAVTVTASRPRRSPFLDRDRDNKPRATVALRIAAGAPFESIARGAASLASSQLNVPMENVDVVNASTHQRWRYDPDREAGGGSSEFMALQRSLGDERTSLAQDALDQLWPGRTVVTVGVELDPSFEIRSERVVPDEQLVKSDRTTKDSVDTGAGGAAGAASGDPSGGGEPANASASGSSSASADANRSSTRKETRDREFVTEIGERRSGKLAPEVKRLTVALLYDRALEQREGFSKDELVRAVKSIVGWDGRRDGEDGFSTLASEFPAAEPVLPAAGPGIADLAARWGPTAGQVFGIALVLLFLRSLLRRPGKRAAAQEQTEDQKEENLKPEEQQKRMRREIERAIATDPASLAKLLESWLLEQKT